jgi:CO/xanthine dehydrogenase Mo-binding subunit
MGAPRSGGATYAAEFNQPGQAYAVIVTSTIAAGRIVDIDDSTAGALPGVFTVLSHKNAPQLAYGEYSPSKRCSWPKTRTSTRLASRASVRSR